MTSPSSTRVILTHVSEGSDCVNGSWILEPGILEPYPDFIAAHFPFTKEEVDRAMGKMKTTEAFWWMVMENSVSVIVKLAAEIKYYIPDKGHEKLYGAVLVSHNSLLPIDCGEEKVL